VAGTTLSLRQLLRHVPVTLTQPLGLRALLRRPSGPLRLDVRPAPFSVMAHNMALLVAPGDYLGTDRDGVVTEICARIRTHTPDVVGLCEVFSDGEREKIRGALNDLYPHFREGPDEADLESDGGLLLLSRHPLLAADDFIYRDCDGDDCYANKGMIHIRVQSGSWPTPIDIFHTHAQDISTDDGVDTLYAQLLKMQEFIQSRANPAFPAIVMGDLNIPGEIPQHYARLLSSLAGTRDCWTIVGNSAASGPTSVRDSNFYEDDDDRPAQDQRFDYVLLRAGDRAVPIVSSVDILKFTRNGRFISDHFGVRPVFEIAARVQP
jgi:endonuclease/exonuclease/phosphatase family metal-dependent hydrolase